MGNLLGNQPSSNNNGSFQTIEIISDNNNRNSTSTTRSNPTPVPRGNSSSRANSSSVSRGNSSSVSGGNSSSVSPGNSSPTSRSESLGNSTLSNNSIAEPHNNSISEGDLSSSTSSNSPLNLNFDSWQEALSHALDHNNLTAEISQEFINHLQTTISTDEAQKIKSSVLLGSKGVMSDEMYRIIYNQLNNTNPSASLRLAIKTIRPGGAGMSHQNVLKKKYTLESVSLDVDSDDMVELLHRKDKIVLCESMVDDVMVDDVMVGFHAEVGHLNPTAFCKQFKGRFYCLINDDLLKEKYDGLNCEPTLPPIADSINREYTPNYLSIICNFQPLYTYANHSNALSIYERSTSLSERLFKDRNSLELLAIGGDNCKSATCQINNATYNEDNEAICIFSIEIFLTIDCMVSVNDAYELLFCMMLNGENCASETIGIIQASSYANIDALTDKSIAIISPLDVSSECMVYTIYDDIQSDIGVNNVLTVNWRSKYLDAIILNKELLIANSIKTVIDPYSSQFKSHTSEAATYFENKHQECLQRLVILNGNTNNNNTLCVVMNVIQTIPQIPNGPTAWNSSFKTDAFTMNEAVRGDILAKNNKIDSNSKYYKILLNKQNENNYLLIGLNTNLNTNPLLMATCGTKYNPITCDVKVTPDSDSALGNAVATRCNH